MFKFCKIFSVGKPNYRPLTGWVAWKIGTACSLFEEKFSIFVLYSLKYGGLLKEQTPPTQLHLLSVTVLAVPQGVTVSEQPCILILWPMIRPQTTPSYINEFLWCAVKVTSQMATSLGLKLKEFIYLFKEVFCLKECLSYACSQVGPSSASSVSCCITLNHRVGKRLTAVWRVWRRFSDGGENIVRKSITSPTSGWNEVVSAVLANPRNKVNLSSGGANSLIDVANRSLYPLVTEHPEIYM